MTETLEQVRKGGLKAQVVTDFFFLFLVFTKA